MDYYLADVFYTPPGELDEQFARKLETLHASNPASVWGEQHPPSRHTGRSSQAGHGQQQVPGLRVG
jgi:hypothetical protein